MAPSDLKAIFDKLDICGDAQIKLEQVHQITTFKALAAKQSELESGTLKQISPADQATIAAVLLYLQSFSGRGDPLPDFTFEGWRDWLIRHYERKGERAKKRKDAGYEMDDDGHRPAPGKIPSKKKIKNNDKTVHDTPPLPPETRAAKDPEEAHPFAFMDQAFSPSQGDSPQSDFQPKNKAPDAQCSELSFVDFQGRRFSKGKCFHTKTKQGVEIIVGIRSFRSETEANCARLEHLSETFLGKGSNSEAFLNLDFILQRNGCKYVQFRETAVVLLSDLGTESSLPMPKLIYEPRTSRDGYSFAYSWDAGGINEVAVPREEPRVLEGFAGSGGMHLGFKEEGFKTSMAFELDDAAIETFKRNNPDTPFYHGDIREAVKDGHMNTDDEVGQTSSPCQGMSKANRNKEESEIDKENNELSYAFLEMLKSPKRLVGIFENVPGMWSQKGMPYLEKIAIECLRMGYQFRVMVLDSKDYGDPQSRKRLFLIAAKYFVKLPDRPAPTHGPNRENYRTAKDALWFLQDPIGIQQNYPNTGDCKKGNFTDSVRDKDYVQLDPNKPAPCLLTKPKLFHYAENGRYLTVREYAALQSYPLNYQFYGNVDQMYQQIGNSVPVGLARAIARSVRDVLRFKYKEELEQEMADAQQEDQAKEEEEVAEILPMEKDSGSSAHSTGEMSK